MKKNKSFLGTGWGFPPAFNNLTGTVQMVSHDEDIEQSITILFATAIGERVMVPGYGCNLQPFLFKNADVSMLNEVKETISLAILNYEPRIYLNSIDIDTDNILNGQLFISVTWTVRSTNSRNNAVFPFYLSEGNLMQTSFS